MSRRCAGTDPVVCAVCKRAAGPNGWRGDARNAPILWRCTNEDCAPLLKKIYTMPVRELSQVEAFSLMDAGDQAGQYLQSLGKTDLADLSQEEWARFLKIVLMSYETAMRERLTGKAA